MEVNSLTGMLRAVQSGLGLAALPDYMGVELDGLLTRGAGGMAALYAALSVGLGVGTAVAGRVVGARL